MRANLAAAIAMIREHEGGYVDHPSDPGGCTNYGITIATYRQHVDPHGTCADLKRMDPAIAERIYADTYWGAVNGDGLPPGVDLMVFDHGVNAGPTRAAKLLQRLLGVEQDGAIGPITATAAWAKDPLELVQSYADARLDYYRALATWKKFGRGWESRVRGTEDKAIDAIAPYRASLTVQEPLPIAAGQSEEQHQSADDEPIGPAVLILTHAGVEVGRVLIPAGVDAHIEPLPEETAA